MWDGLFYEGSAGTAQERESGEERAAGDSRDDVKWHWESEGSHDVVARLRRCSVPRSGHRSCSAPLRVVFQVLAGYSAPATAPPNTVPPALGSSRNASCTRASDLAPKSERDSGREHHAVHRAVHHEVPRLCSEAQL